LGPPKLKKLEDLS